MELKNISKWRRTHYCGDLRKGHVGKDVTLCGWVNRQRDIGNLIFIDLRDREGIVQLVVTSENPELLEQAKKVKMEYVVGSRGVVKEREEKLKNPDMSTGEVEIQVSQLKIFNASKVPPFVISDPPQASEETRFKYRYLDLRRPSMQRNVKLRHQAALVVRNFMSRNGFYEIETPFLTKSTPEGARDYLVPSRVYKGKFFALPQSPQLFKQLLMIAGFDRYFQIVRCFRDEDLRADRQPEFTQIDVEMSFVERDELFKLNEEMMAELFSIAGADIERPFPRLTFAQSMEKYGTDKPDLRFENEIADLTELGRHIPSEVIQKALSAGGELKGLVVEKGGSYSRSQLDKLNQKAQALGSKGIIWIKKAEQFKSSLGLEQKDFQLIWEEIRAEAGDLVLIAADERLKALSLLGEIRCDFLPEDGKNADTYKFAWVTDFPLFEWSDEEQRLVSMHHPFTSPQEEDVDLLDKEPQAVRAQAYDLVLNGVEIGGGSIRINNLELQKRVFRALGLDPSEMEEKFGFFLNALEFGAPPHGGIALGFDRIIMLLAGEETIRDVIPFPKTTSSLSLLTNSPSSAGRRQLAELGLKIIK